jgi:hypothetical protein
MLPKHTKNNTPQGTALLGNSQYATAVMCGDLHSMGSKKRGQPGQPRRGRRVLSHPA